MKLEEAYNICCASHSTETEICDVIAYYIKLRKNRVVRIAPPYEKVQYNNPITHMLYQRELNLMMKMYEVASEFIIVLHTRPDVVKVKVYV